MNTTRSYFAAVCMMAVASAELEPRTDFSKMALNLESHLLRRGSHLPASRKPHPDSIPNWMRGFYDDIDTDRHIERIHEPLRSH